MRNKKPALMVSFAIFALLSVVGSIDAQQIKNAIPDIARPLPLSAVRLTGGPLKHAQELDIDYLLKLEPDRMMAGYRIRAGLTPKAEGYGGWDSPNGKQLTGHIAGHYLSAVSLMYAATGDVRFKERADYLVKEMKEVQDKRANGYLGAITDTKGTEGEAIFEEVARGNIRSSFFDLNGLWSPWYTLHKTFAGLRDAYRFTGNRTALEVEAKFAAWAETILSKLDQAQTQKMLNTEFGGMNEVLADLYADTGDKRWLDLSHHFDHQAVRDPLSRHEDILAGLHGNTQVPKMIGYLARYIYTGDKTDGAAAEFFWDAVALHHSYATGGHGRDEYFGPPDKLGDRVEGRTDESCNVYNMLKMTRTLFAIHPEIKYAEFEERALFNHVLGSIDPEDGRTCYMVPVGRGVQHEYQDMLRGFTCCVGSGMESHGLHGDGIYYESGDKLWVNLYAPSTANWQTAGVNLAMETTFPEGDSATLRISTPKTKQFTLALRRPSWAGTGFTIKVNGVAMKDVSKPGSYVEVKRSWKNGDTVALTLPKTLRIEPTPDTPTRVALMWGPLVLAGDLGPERERRGGGSPIGPIPSFVSNGAMTDWLKPAADKPGNFHAVGRDDDDQAREVDLVPFYRLHRRSYTIYWDLYSAEGWKQKLSEVAGERERQRKLEAATISALQPGEAEKEKAFNQQGEETTIDRMLGRTGRRGRKWFSFDVPVEPSGQVALVVTYNTEQRPKRAAEILIDGQHIGEQAIEGSPNGSAVGHFFDVDYKIPANLIKDKRKVTVRFQATSGSEIPTVFGVRTIRADAPQ
jgi:DUF1680 family protein